MGSRGSSQLATGPDKTLRDWESRSGALDLTNGEIGLLLDARGNTITNVTQPKPPHSIFGATVDLGDDATLERARNGYMIHNHPEAPSPHSVTDMQVAQKFGLKSVVIARVPETGETIR